MDANSAILTQEAFLKASKRLHKHFSQSPSTRAEPLKLSEIQEALARSFSFRSLHDALSKLPEGPTPTNADASMSPFSRASRFSELLIAMLPDTGDSMWRGRAISLISAAAIVSEAKAHLDGLPFRLSAFSEQITLETLLADLKRHDLPQGARAAILSYIASLPGYDPSKPCEPSATVREQHSFLSMQAERPLALLSMVEFRDVLLFDSSWLATAEGSALAFKPSILQLEHIEWSWLFHPAFAAIVQKKISSSNATALRASDLLALQSNSFISDPALDPKKLLDVIFSHYQSALALSARIQIAAL